MLGGWPWLGRLGIGERSDPKHEGEQSDHEAAVESSWSKERGERSDPDASCARAVSSCGGFWVAGGCAGAGAPTSVWVARSWLQEACRGTVEPPTITPGSDPR